jgi:hypothetical protein
MMVYWYEGKIEGLRGWKREKLVVMDVFWGETDWKDL